MADNFGLKIGLEGEKEFKKALADINSSFKVLGSEMKLVASQFDKNDKSVDALTSRNTVLNKEIEAQKQKIEVLRAALQNAAESFGENDRRTQAWQIQLNNAEAALNDMERELADNNAALDEANAGYGRAEDALDGMDREMDNVTDSADDMGDEIDEAGDAAKDRGCDRWPDQQDGRRRCQPAQRTVERHQQHGKLAVEQGQGLGKRAAKEHQRSLGYPLPVHGVCRYR